MTREQDKKLVQEVTNNLLTNKFANEVGQKAIVKRTDIENERMGDLREVLECIGADLQKIGAVPQGMDYLGSFSVHAYKATALNEVAFATISAHKPGLSIDIADGALRELTNNTFVKFGHKPKLRRSGI